MKKMISLIAAVAAFLFFASSPAWAGTYSLTPDQESTGSSSTTYVTSLKEFTYQGITWKFNQWNPKTLQIKTNQTSASSEFRFYNTSAFPGKITQVVITFSALTVADASNLMFKGGSSEVSGTSGGTAGTWDSTNKTLTWTPSANDNFTFFAFYQNGKAASGSNYLASSDAIVVTYEGTVTPTCATPTFSPTAGSYTTTQNVTISTTTEGATIYYTTDGETPTTSSSVYSSAIVVSEDKTIKAIAIKDGYNDSVVATADYKIVHLNHAGTAEDPYTVADARAAIDGGIGLTNVYAKGIISKVDSYSSNTITYWISDDGTTTTELEVYKGKGLNGTNFTAISDVVVGATVVVKGNLKKFNSTYEFDKDNQLYSYEAPAVMTPVIVTSTTTLSGMVYELNEGPSTNKTFTVSGSNLTEDITLSLTGTAFEMSLSASSDFSNTLSLEQTSGAVANKVVYVRLKAVESGNYNSTITISSAGATEKTIALSGTVKAPTFASLPFTFNSGRESFEATNGLYQGGLGSDYGSAPLLRFDSTGDSVRLQFSETPGPLYYAIKGNGFSGGTFTVQSSADGVNYTDIKTYTELDGTVQNECISNLGSEVRYIKWVYTEKKTGNVALGNISLGTTSPDTKNLTGTLNDGRYWATFFSGTKRYSLPEGAHAFTMHSDHKLYQLGTKGNVIPANTAVIIISDTAAITLTEDFSNESVTVTQTNILKGADNAVAVSGITGTPYVLGIVGGTLGFYPFTSSDIPAAKAYYNE